MKCINCGAEFRNEIDYCMRCGTYLNSGVTVTQKDEFVNTQRIDRESLVKAYVGNKYHKFAYNSFSILYFLYGPLYGFSRKMYFYSFFNIILFFILFMCKNLVKEYIVVLAVIIIMIVSSFSFNNAYIRKSRKRVDKIVLNNSSLDFVRLQNICRQLGGLNLFFVFINVVIGIAFFAGITICVLDLFDVINFLETNYLVELYNLIKNKFAEWFKI